MASSKTELDNQGSQIAERDSDHHTMRRERNIKDSVVARPEVDIRKKNAAKAEATDRIEVKKYQAVAYWKWDLNADTCAICHTHIMERCIECEASDLTEPCNPAWGTCGHCYHFHCVSKWLKTRQVCPLDNNEWNWARVHYSLVFTSNPNSAAS